MSKPKFRIAICGGGLGGLALALVLLKFSDDIQVDIYEATSHFSEVGAGIKLWKRSWFILKAIGLEESLLKLGLTPPEDKPSPGAIFRKADQREENSKFHRMIAPQSSVSMHRVDLLKVLIDALPVHCSTHFNKRLVSYQQLDTIPGEGGKAKNVTLRFADSTIVEADVLVGADGINSATRRTMFSNPAEEQHARPTWSGSYAYRSLLDTSKLLKISPGHEVTSTAVIYLGKDKHVVGYPISQGRIINLLAYYTVPGGEGSQYEGPSVVDASPAEVLELFEDWKPEARNLIQCMEKTSRWAISHHRGTPRVTCGRVALLGDAAHAMAPHLGAGAGQAIEDAYILGRLIAHPLVRLENLSEVLEIYQKICLPAANDAVERTRTAGLIYELNHAPAFGCIDEETSESDLVGRVMDAVYGQWIYQWEGPPEDDWVVAEKMLLDAIGRSSKVINTVSQAHASPQYSFEMLGKIADGWRPRTDLQLVPVGSA